MHRSQMDSLPNFRARPTHWNQPACGQCLQCSGYQSLALLQTKSLNDGNGT